VPPLELETDAVATPGTPTLLPEVDVVVPPVRPLTT
jgi:hypothetical protein